MPGPLSGHFRFCFPPALIRLPAPSPRKRGEETRGGVCSLSSKRVAEWGWALGLAPSRLREKVAAAG
ncbi:hypothetical protein F2981_04510 [Sinorhizobium meliloti]|nr:hypothetical protein [Sinorhizobium meliloti]